MLGGIYVFWNKSCFGPRLNSSSLDEMHYEYEHIKVYKYAKVNLIICVRTENIY